MVIYNENNRVIILYGKDSVKSVPKGKKYKCYDYLPIENQEYFIYDEKEYDGISGERNEN